MIAARLRLAARDGLLDRIETADKIGEQSKDIVRDASAGRVLCDDERTADLRHKRVRIANPVMAQMAPGAFGLSVQAESNPM